MKKFLLYGAAAGVLALVIAAAALKILFPPAKVKALALAELEEKLARKVELNGEARLGLQGIHLAGVNLPDDGKSDLAAASFKSLDARPAWKKLLLARELEIVQLRLQGGAVRYRERNAGAAAPVYQLTDVDLAAAGVRLRGPFSAELSCTLAAIENGKNVLEAALAFKGRVDAGGGDNDAVVLDADALTLTHEGITIEAAGKIVNISSPTLDLTFKLPALRYQKGHRYLGGLPPWLALPPTRGALAAKSAARLDVEKLTLEGEGLAVAASAAQTANGWKIRPTTLQWGDIRLDLSGTVAAGKSGQALDLKLKSNEIDLAKLPLELLKDAPADLSGRVALDAAVTGTRAAPAVAGAVELKGIALSAAEQKLSALTGRVDIAPARVEGKIAGLLNGEKLTLDLDAKGYAGSRPEYALNGTLAALDLSKLPSSAPAPAAPAKKSEAAAKPTANASSTPVKTRGKITIGKIKHPQFEAGKTTLDWDLDDLEPSLSRLDGSLKFAVGSGRFDNLSKLVEGKPLAKLVLMPILILQRASKKVKALPGFDQVAFTEIVGDYRFKNGLMTVHKSHLDSAIAYATLTGSADLGKDGVDMRVSTRLLGRLKTGAPIDFKVSGKLSDPQVKIDMRSVIKQPEVEKAVQKGADLLKGLFK